MADLTPEVEQQLASMSDTEWSALGARLRAPDTREQIRAAAAKLLGGDEDRANTFAEIARHEALVTDGQVDANKLRAALAQVGLIAPVPQRNYGQGSGAAPGQTPGAAGKAAAAKRFGTNHNPHPGTAAASGAVTGGPGSAGRAAAAKRFGNPEGK